MLGKRATILEFQLQSEMASIVTNSGACRIMSRLSVIEIVRQLYSVVSSASSKAIFESTHMDHLAHRLTICPQLIVCFNQ